MSGFVAIINTDGSPIDRPLLETLTNRLAYRGPDRNKIWINDHVGFGHTLLQTTDEARYEDLPDSLDGNSWITGSIRLDNRTTLLRSLDKQSKIHLTETPDSSLILHAYKQWGKDCLSYLQGDFSFTLWDNDKQQLFCARDHFGMRQLYFSQAGGDCLILSNCLSCICEHPAVSKELNDEALAGFLLFGDHIWLDKTITVYKGIRSLQSGHSLVVANRNTSIKKYWDIPSNIPRLHYHKKEDYLEHFQEIFQESITDRLRTDKIVIAMSGGMDSSAIAAVLSQIKRDVHHHLQLQAVTISYDTVHPCRERHFAQLTANKLSLPIQYINGDCHPFLSGTVNTTRPQEILQPQLFLDTYRTHSFWGRVVLNGAAADNLLKYPASPAILTQENPWELLQNILYMYRVYGRIPGIGTGLCNKWRYGWPRHKTTATPYPYPSWLNKDFEKRLHLVDCWEQAWKSPKSDSFRSRQSLLKESLMQPEWCTDDIVTYSDFTLPEMRDPYLDLRLLEFVLSLPPLPWLFHKHILRQAMSGTLPVQVIQRPKTPLGTLHTSLLKHCDKKLVDEWEILPEIEHCVERSAIPKLATNSYDSGSSYIDMRPLLLNRWLAGFQ